MRVALIGPVSPRLGGQTPGGVATHQEHLAEGLAAAGAQVALLATNTRVSSDAWAADAGIGGTLERGYQLFPMLDELRFTPAAIRQLGGVARWARYVARASATHGLGSRREVLRNLLVYARFLEHVRPDVVHVQHPLERCAYVRIVRERERMQAPLVVTAHSLIGEHADETIHGLMAPNLRAADRVIAVSEHIAEQAVQLGVHPARIRVIRSGVDTERFRPRDRAEARRQLGVPDETRLVLFVGNLEPRKQVDVLLRAIADIRGRVPELSLIVVGSGESAGVRDQTARLARLSGELGLTDAVRFIGRLGDEELLQAYAAADVFALPSSSEAQGIVALEAMACGLAVVASAVGGLLGTIEDGRTGRLVASGDVDALAEAVLELLGKPALRERTGAAAREVVERRFAWRETIQATLGVYREVLGCG